MAKTLSFRLTEPQASFLEMDCKYPAFIAGYGTGKTFLLCLKAVLDSLASPDAVIGIYEPSFKLVRKVIVPTMRKICYELGIDFDSNYHKTEFRFDVPLPGAGTILFNTMEDPESIVGDECFRIHVDELDTFNRDKAELAWNKIIGRCRQWPRNLNPAYLEYNENTDREEPKNQVCVYTTPEGYRFVYENWQLNKTEDNGMIQASTYSNPFLPESYIESIKKQYPEALIDAYLKGMFVNMKSGSVYKAFNREVHNSQESIRPDEILYIGCDFNVERTAATVFVRRSGGKIWHIVDELKGLYDVNDLILSIKEHWPTNKIIMYPDASGKNRKAVNASISELALLSQAGFEIRANPSNPAVKDRVLSLNRAFEKGHLFVNVDNCPEVVRCLEQQAYDKNGDPDKKSGTDHQNDATGYPIVFEMPIRKPILNIPISFYTAG